MLLLWVCPDKPRLALPNLRVHHIFEIALSMLTSGASSDFTCLKHQIKSVFCFTTQLQLDRQQRLDCALKFAVRPNAAMRIPLGAAACIISVRV